LGAILKSLENPNTWLVANIEKALEARDWRPADLARSTGITPGGLAHILKGRSWPGPDTLARIAAALSLEPADLLRSPAGNDAVRKPAKLRLLELVAAFDEDQAKRLLPDAELVRSGFGKSPPPQPEELESDESESGSGQG
jgi:transcriptional regulator with XRE-family HTH domain